jgi:hypothetical protein
MKVEEIELPASLKGMAQLRGVCLITDAHRLLTPVDLLAGLWPQESRAVFVKRPRVISSNFGVWA